MARPRRYKKGKQISLRLDEILLDALNKQAYEQSLDRSQLINQLLKKGIKNSPYSTQEEPGQYADKCPRKK
jgi:hypothetical protein